VLAHPSIHFHPPSFRHLLWPSFCCHRSVIDSICGPSNPKWWVGEWTTLSLPHFPISSPPIPQAQIFNHPFFPPIKPGQATGRGRSEQHSIAHWE
jgi:hypothetical protein